MAEEPRTGQRKHPRTDRAEISAIFLSIFFFRHVPEEIIYTFHAMNDRFVFDGNNKWRIAGKMNHHIIHQPERCGEIYSGRHFPYFNDLVLGFITRYPRKRSKGHKRVSRDSFFHFPLRHCIFNVFRINLCVISPTRQINSLNYAFFSGRDQRSFYKLLYALCRSLCHRFARMENWILSDTSLSEDC